MMLTIHGLPSSVKYQELKALIKQKCNISQFILDNLVSEEDGTKKVRIGVADENEGTILVKTLYGYNMNGCRLRIQPVGKTPLLTTPKQANYDSRVNYEPRSEYSTQAMDPHGTSRAMYPPHTSKPTNYPYEHGADVLQKMDSGSYSQREVYVHNRPQEQTYGYQTKSNVLMVNEDRRVVEIRPHVLRTVELEHGPVAKPYQPAPQTYSQPQQKPVTIFKDNFQGPTQGYNFNQMNQPIQQSYQGRQDVTRPVWTQDESKPQLGYVKPSVASYNKPSVYEERKMTHHPSSEHQQTRALLKTPTNYDHPKYSHIPQTTRMSPPRRSSPVRRISPNKRLISPQGRQDLRRPSPSRGASPRRRMSPSRRPSPRKSPPSNRRLLSPPPRQSPPRTSPPRRSYYEDSDKYDNRSSGHHAPQVRSAHEKQMAQNQYSGDYGSSSSQNRAPPPTKSSAPWQGTKSIYPRDSPKERDIAKYVPEHKYQSAAKPGYPRDSDRDREIIRNAPENKNQHGAKPMYPRHSPVERSAVKRAPENKYQHFDILSVKELHHPSTSAPLKRSRSPVRRNRTPPRRSPRKQSPPRRPWPQDRERSPLLGCPPSPPSWPHRSRDEKEHPSVWQRNEELQHRDYHHKPEDDWKKDTGFVDSRDKYDGRSEFTGCSNDRVPMEKYKYHDEPRRPSSPQRKEYYPGPESDRQHHEYKRHVLDRRDQIVKHHEDYAKRPKQYPKHQDVPTKYPEPFAKAPERFNKNEEQPYKRHEEFPTRHGQFSGDDGQFPGRSAHHSPRHQGSFPKRQEPLLKYEEPVRRYQEPLLKYEEPVATRLAPPPNKYSEPVTKRHDSYGRPQEQYTKHQEPFSKRQEKNPMHQDQYSDRRDDHYRSDENRKQREEFRYSADNKRIDNRPGRPDDAPWREAKEATQKPEGSFTELSKRAQDWAQGIGKYGNTAQEEKKGDPVDTQLRQKAINVITRKILARHNVKMKDERQKKISICLRKMIEKRVNNIIDKRDMNLLEIQHKFRQTHSVQDEEKMYFDAVAVYPQKRHIEDSGGPPQKMAKKDDRNMDKTGNTMAVKTNQQAEATSEPNSASKDVAKSDERQVLPTEHYELSPLMEKALYSEIDVLMAKIWKQFPDAPPNDAERIVVDRYRNKSGDDFRHVLALNVAQRILNIHNQFYVKVQFSELPRGRTINTFIRKYNIGKFERVSRNKRATAKNTFTGSVSSFRDFDRLCKIKQTQFDGIKVNISSYYGFNKCPAQLKFNKATKEIGSQIESKEIKSTDRSNSENESIKQSIDTKDDIEKEVNIVIEFKVEEKGDAKKDDNAVKNSDETFSTPKSQKKEPKPPPVQIKKEVQIKEEKDERKEQTVKKELTVQKESTENEKVTKEEDPVKKEKTVGKLNTTKEKVNQGDVDEREFEDILSNSIVLDECVASDED